MTAKKLIGIEDFHTTAHPSGITIVPWDELKRVLGDDGYEKFIKWMTGQTCVREGVYLHDVRNYLSRLNTGREEFWD